MSRKMLNDLIVEQEARMEVILTVNSGKLGRRTDSRFSKRERSSNSGRSFQNFLSGAQPDSPGNWDKAISMSFVEQ